jgi:L-lactate dehydrogenase complex protein LldF
MRKLREQQVERGLRPWGERAALAAMGLAGAAAARCMRWRRSWARATLKWLAEGEDRIRVLGLAPSWTAGRDFPAPEGRTFRELYAERKSR